MRSGLVIFILLATVRHVSAQQVEAGATPAPRNAWDSLRSYYIKNFPDYFFVYPVIKQRSLSFELEKRKGDRNLVTFKPNNTYSLGLGLYLFELNFELAFAVPIDEKSIKLYGESKARDVQLNLLGKKWGLDAFYQKYGGFYVNESGNTPPPDIPFPQRPDIGSRNLGLTANYVFNNQKFSFRSAYNFAERQIFSKGSFLIFSSLASFKMDADSSILSKPQRAVFGDNVAFRDLRYTTFSIAPGYTYSMTFKSFFLNGTLAIGPAHHWIKYRLDGGNFKNDITLNSFVTARISMGYNGERIFGGISFLTQGSNVKFEDARFSNNNGAFKILIGYRFGEFGFLKKRVWDYVPFKI